MPKTEINFEKLKAELNKLTTSESLKAEINKITAEIQSVKNKITDSPQAQAQIKKLESLYKDAQKSLHQAHKQFESEISKAKIAIKKTTNEIEKKIYSLKEEALAAKDRFSSGGPAKKSKKKSTRKKVSSQPKTGRKKVSRKKATPKS